MWCRWRLILLIGQVHIIQSTTIFKCASPFSTHYQKCVVLHSRSWVWLKLPSAKALHPSIAFKTMTGECGSDNFKRMENWWYSINTNWHQCISKLAVSAVQNRVQCLWSMWGGREDGGKGPHHMCVSLISAITWLAFCKACGHRVEKTV